VNASRLEAFSDGVIAIIITVMVLELRQPAGATFHALRATAPSFFAYALSFVEIAIYWINHHSLLKTVRRLSAGVLWSNLHLLFWLSLFPFATAWMAENHFSRDTVATYGVVLVMAAVSYTVLLFSIMRDYDKDSTLRRAIGRDLKGKWSLGAYLASIPLAFAWPWASVALFVAVSVTWFIPDRRLEKAIAESALSD